MRCAMEWSRSPPLVGHWALVQPPGAEPQVPPPQAEGAMPVLMEENPFLDPDEEEPRETIPHCPRCAAPLVARKARKGPHAGRLFLACSRFPECRYAAPQESVKH